MSKKLEAFKEKIAKMDTYKLLGLYGDIYYTWIDEDFGNSDLKLQIIEKEILKRTGELKND